MKAKSKAEFTAAANTRVARRKLDSLARNLARAITAAHEEGKPVDLFRCLLPWQVGVVIRRADSAGMTTPDYILSLIRRGLEKAEKGRVA